MPGKISSGPLHGFFGGVKKIKEKLSEKIKQAKPGTHIRSVERGSLPEKIQSSQQRDVTVRGKETANSLPKENKTELALAQKEQVLQEEKTKQRQLDSLSGDGGLSAGSQPSLPSATHDSDRPSGLKAAEPEDYSSPPDYENVMAEIKGQKTSEGGIKNKLFGGLARLAAKNKQNSRLCDEISQEKKALNKEIKKYEKQLACMKDTGHCEGEREKLRERLASAHKKMKGLEDEKARLKKEDKDDLQNKGSLIRFFYDFVTSLRKLYKARKAGQKETKIAALTWLSVPKLTVESPDGLIEFSDLKLALKVPEFKHTGDKQWQPVFGIDHLEGKVAIPVNGKEPLQVNVEMKNLRCQIKASWGKDLHDYICNEYKGLAFFDLLKLMGKLNRLQPEDLSIEGDSASLTLVESRAETLSALVEMPGKTPGSVIDSLFEKLDFPLRLKLARMNIDAHGDLSMGAEVNKPQLEYGITRPVDNQVKQKKQQRCLSFAAEGGRVDVKQGDATAKRILAGLSLKNPFDVLPGQRQPPEDRRADQVKASESLTLQLKAVKEVSVSREVVQSTPDSWQLTGVDSVKADIEEVTANNKGMVNGECCLYGVQVNGATHSDKKMHVSAEVKRGHLDMDAPEQMMPAKIAGKPFVVKGKARASLDGLVVEAAAEGGKLKADAEVKGFSLENSEETTVKVGEDGVIIPQGLKLTTQGKLVQLADNKLRIKPDIQASGSADIKLIEKGKEVALPVNIKNAAEQLSIEVPVNTSSESDAGSPTCVVTDGGLNLSDLQVGPIQVSDIKVNMDAHHNGELKIDAALDLKHLMAMAWESDQAIPWYIKSLLKNKTVRVFSQAGIEKGQCLLDGLRFITVKFEAHKDASLFDRMVTKALNLCARWGVGGLRTFKTGKHHVREEAGGIERQVKRPFVEFRLGSIRKVINLPLPERCLNETANTLDIPLILHETVGATALTSDLLAEASLTLRNLESGETDVCLPAVDRLHALAIDAAAKPGLIQLLARRWPLDPTKRLVGQMAGNTEYLGKLAEIADVFARHQPLQATALMIADLLKPTRGHYIQQMIDDPEGFTETDIAVKGLLYEQKGELESAKKCYQEAMESRPRDPLINTRLGHLLLQEMEQCKTAIPGNSEEKIFKAMNYLLTAVQQGQKMAMAEFDAAIKSEVPVISEVASLYQAAVIFKGEKTYDDFSKALTLLESISAESIIHDYVVEMLTQRVQNGRHTFHNENVSEFDKTEKQIQRYFKRLEKKKAPPKGHEAYELAIKLLYGARGATFSDRYLQQADFLLARAAEGDLSGDHLKMIALHRKVAAKERENRKLAKTVQDQ